MMHKPRERQLVGRNRLVAMVARTLLPGAILVAKRANMLQQMQFRSFLARPGGVPAAWEEGKVTDEHLLRAERMAGLAVGRCCDGPLPRGGRDEITDSRHGGQSRPGIRQADGAC